MGAVTILLRLPGWLIASRGRAARGPPRRQAHQSIVPRPRRAGVPAVQPAHRRAGGRLRPAALLWAAPAPGAVRPGWRTWCRPGVTTPGPAVAAPPGGPSGSPAAAPGPPG